MFTKWSGGRRGRHKDNVNDGLVSRDVFDSTRGERGRRDEWEVRSRDFEEGTLRRGYVYTSRTG